jgi:hypothetical protein
VYGFCRVLGVQPLTSPQCNERSEWPHWVGWLPSTLVIQITIKQHKKIIKVNFIFNWITLKKQKNKKQTKVKMYRKKKSKEQPKKV